MAFHSSIGPRAVAMTCGLLLTALLPYSSGPRQHIRGIAHGVGFLGHPSHEVHAGDPCSAEGPSAESRSWVTPFRMSALWSVRTVLSTGFCGSEYWSAKPLPAP